MKKLRKMIKMIFTRPSPPLLFLLVAVLNIAIAEGQTDLLDLENVGGLRASSNNGSGNGNQDGVRGRPSREYNCDDGCGLDVVGNGPPVCGTDGATYFNECLAVCQGVEINRPGVCPGDNPISSNDNTYVREGRVSKDEMLRFKNENFKYVSKRIFVDPDPETFEPQYDENTISQISEEKTKGKSRAFRITSEGDEYVSPEIEDFSLEYDDFLSPSEGTEEDINDIPLNAPEDTDDSPLLNAPEDTEEDNGGRGLAVIGGAANDSRYRITSTTSYPYKLIGHLLLKLANGKTPGCSGTVISVTSILTNGHCVYDTTRNAYYNILEFAPGRNGGSSPYGTYQLHYITLYSDYKSGKGGEFDIAVMALKPRKGIFIGDSLGYTGLAVTDPNSSALQSATVTGYPGDKDWGTMWTSGSSCLNSYQPYGTYGVTHRCDTAPGMSGSALMNGPYVHGVHWGGSSTYNLGNILRSGRRFNDIREWSGRGSFGIIRTNYDMTKCMDYNFSNGNIYMHECYNNNNQQFYYDIATQQIKSIYTNTLCLNKKSNNDVIMWTCHGNNNQKWYYDSSTKQIKSRENNQCLDFNFSNDNLYMHSCHNGSNQKFTFPALFWT